MPSRLIGQSRSLYLHKTQAYGMLEGVTMHAGLLESLTLKPGRKTIFF